MIEINETAFGLDLKIQSMICFFDSFFAFLALGKDCTKYVVTTSIRETPGYFFQEELAKAFSSDCVVQKQVASLTGNQVYAIFSLPIKDASHCENLSILQFFQVAGVQSKNVTTWCKLCSKPEPFSPSFILWNRFDIRFGSRAEWCELHCDERAQTIGLINFCDHICVGILFLPLCPAELQSLFSFLFIRYPTAKYISYQFSEYSMINAWDTIQEREDCCYCLPLDGTYKEILMRSKKKTLYNIRRSWRLLEEKIGSLYLQEYAADECPQHIFDCFFEMKSRRFQLSEKENSREALLHSNRLPITNIYTLETSNGQIISILMCAEQCSSASLVNLTFDPSYKLYSPGVLLYTEVIRILVDKQKEYFYLGSGDYNYKKLFGSQKLYYWVGDVFRHDN